MIWQKLLSLAIHCTGETLFKSLMQTDRQSFSQAAQGSGKKSSSLNGRAIKALPPPLGLNGHRTWQQLGNKFFSFLNGPAIKIRTFIFFAASHVYKLLFDDYKYYKRLYLLERI